MKLTAADAIVLAGLGVIGLGLYFVYAPLAAVWAGALAVYFGGTIHRQRKEGGK